MPKKKPNICFCALNAYPLLCKADIGFIGGSEFQQTLIAKGLVHDGYDVSFTVFDHGQSDIVIKDGIKLFKTVPPNSTFSSVSSLFSSLKILWKLFKKIDADIYIQQCASIFTGLVAFFCYLNNKRFIYLLASDMDADIRLINQMPLYERMAYKFALKISKPIISQTYFQQNKLMQDLGLDSIVIKNPIPLEKNPQKERSNPLVLWVGSIKPQWKCPELFLKLATDLPNVRFQMIGGPSTNYLFYEKIKSMAKCIPNLQFIGYIPYPQINDYFRNASILVNTSSVEGFPNTFLQAWSAQIPVVSLNVDPDEIICNYNLGFHSRSFDRLISDIMSLVENPKLINDLGLNGRRYVEEEHDIRLILNNYKLAIDYF